MNFWLSKCNARISSEVMYSVQCPHLFKVLRLTDAREVMQGLKIAGRGVGLPKDHEQVGCEQFRIRLNSN
jgi:hypothetical protein